MKNILDKLSAKGAAEAEVYYLNKVTETVGFENNQLKTVKTTQNSGIALRTVLDGKVGFTTSTNMDDIDKVIDNAVIATKYSGPKDFEFAPKGSSKVMELQNQKIWDIPTEKMIEEGHHAIEQFRKYDKDILAGVKFIKEKTEVRIINTKGLDEFYIKDTFGIRNVGKLTEGTNFIECESGKNMLTPDYDMKALTEDTIEKLKMARVNSTFEGGNKTVILTPSVLGAILIALRMGVDGKNVLRGTSPLAGKIGEKIFDERFTFIDDGIMAKGVDSAPFDDEGTPMQKTTVIEKGVLKSYLHSLKTAEKLGHAPTGNGLKMRDIFSTKTLNAIPTPAPTNMIVQPGDVAFEEMIANTKDGIIIDFIMGIFMNNLLNGDFSGNISTGYAVKNGKITGRVKDAVINENIYKIFKENITALSNQSYETALFEETGNHRFPYVMLKDIHIVAK